MTYANPKQTPGRRAHQNRVVLALVGTFGLALLCVAIFVSGAHQQLAFSTDHHQIGFANDHDEIGRMYAASKMAVGQANTSAMAGGTAGTSNEPKLDMPSSSKTVKPAAVAPKAAGGAAPKKVSAGPEVGGDGKPWIQEIAAPSYAGKEVPKPPAVTTADVHKAGTVGEKAAGGAAPKKVSAGPVVGGDWKPWIREIAAPSHAGKQVPKPPAVTTADVHKAGTVGEKAAGGAAPKKVSAGPVVGGDWKPWIREIAAPSHAGKQVPKPPAVKTAAVAAKIATRAAAKVATAKPDKAAGVAAKIANRAAAKVATAKPDKAAAVAAKVATRGATKVATAKPAKAAAVAAKVATRGATKVATAKPEWGKLRKDIKQDIKTTIENDMQKDIPLDPAAKDSTLKRLHRFLVKYLGSSAFGAVPAAGAAGASGQQESSGILKKRGGF